MVFEKTLQDIVKGIRASKRDTALYISQCIAEIKTELNSSDMYVKANALQKLTFLHMMGYSMSWASFATIEVMSSPRFAQKRIGYIAASQGFTQDTEVILLTTNLLKKELRGAVGGSMTGVYEAGLAINCVSNIVTEELAQDLLPELTNLTAHPQPYLRKKAVLCLFKLFVKYPQGLRLTFDKIQQCLSDSNPAVVSCSVNVIAELSDKTNPKNYLHLAPAFFDLLTTSSNNWMLIKVVKLLGSLVPEEPRLARKLLEPLADIVKTTPAKSLLYESAHAITKCLPYCRKSDGSMPGIVPDIVSLCAQTFRDFVEEKDQNLKYLGLVGFGSLMISFPKVLSTPGYRPLILACLSDEDVTIRSRALDLLPSMATRKNLVELVTQLLKHVEASTGTYKLELVSRVVEMCSGEKYSLLQDFPWYLDILLEMGHVRGLDAHADLLRSQVSDIALRVLPVRAYAVKRSMEILLEGRDGSVDSAIMQGASTTIDLDDDDNGRGKHLMPEILPAVAWIAGEYSDLMAEAIGVDTNTVYIFNENSEGPYHSVIQALSAPSNSNKMPFSTQAVFLQASMKLFAAASANPQVSNAELEACVRTISCHLGVYMQSTNVEVRNRATSLNGILFALNLIPETFGALRDVTQTKDEEKDKYHTVNRLEADLLGMRGPGNVEQESTSNASTESKDKNDTLLPLSAPTGPNLDGASSSLAMKCRNSSLTLKYLLKASPMKPTGAKAQRKKHQNPVGVTLDLRTPTDFSVFSDWIQEEKAQRAGSRVSIESVSFTQQRPLSSVPDSRNILIDAVSSHTGSMSRNDNAATNIGERPSFQNINSGSSTNGNTTGANPATTANDPFYLSSSSVFVDSEASAPASNLANRFGAIQLGDVDEENEIDLGDGPSRNKKKKKKEKKSKKQGSTSDEMGAVCVDALHGRQGVAIYDSEDDEDGRDNTVRLPPSRRRGGRKAAGKEFNSLAKVDLTIPLREDEVMPERRHRVVPDPPQPDFTQTTPSNPMPAAHSHKKKKKESKKSKKASNLQYSTVPSNENQTGDLLDLGAFSDHVPNAQPDQSFMPAQSNAVNNAFDDLLGLPTTNIGNQIPADPLLNVFGATTNGMAAAVESSQIEKNGKRLYLRATVKSSSATGSLVVNWDQILLSYRVYRSQGPDNRLAASISVRVDNQMEMSGLTGLVLRLKDHGDIMIGDVAAGSFVESLKSGPMYYTAPDSALDLKGMLVTMDCSVPIKLTLPISSHLVPANAQLMTTEVIASELSNEGWSGHSAKIPITSYSPEKIKSSIGAFLHLLEVEPSDQMHGTFAGQTFARGIAVRVLVKVKKDAVKIDVKAMDSDVTKALVSELKKLVL
jgi:AP-3 complex subunit delta-1